MATAADDANIYIPDYVVRVRMRHKDDVGVGHDREEEEGYDDDQPSKDCKRSPVPPNEEARAGEKG
jgi:hypothetical protein